ncbi:MAG: toll/interleukin-1 receptor domain-containing protein [Candidatus Lokiarchaeota archaeon]|nr:toll/interleukin-1 receptor domain-containing protein [Candidatus Lokiarchaeota archaeon]
MLSYVGWITGGTAIVVVIFGCIFGLFLISKSKKSKTKLLFYAGLMIIFGGLCYLGSSYDFLIILLSGSNMDNTYGLLGILGGMWIIPGLLIAIYIGVELLTPDKKRYIIPIYLILGIVYELFIFLDPLGSHTFIPPTKSGEDLIEDIFKIGAPAGILSVIFLLSMLTFNGFGFLLRSFQSKGVVRKKYLLLSIGFFLYLTFGILDGYAIPGIALIFVRLGYLIAFLFMYSGLKPHKPAKPKKKKIPTKREIELASYMLGKPIPTEIIGKNIPISNEIQHRILIFVSYATKDVNLFKIHEIVKMLTNFQEIKDVLYWEEDMDDNIFEYMNENLNKCDIIVLFCSKNALNSVPVKKEWTAAEAIGKPIIPVFFDIDHIPTLLKSRLGIEYDFYDIQKNIHGLHDLILKKFLGSIE